MKIMVLETDITKTKVDAIVNPANAFGYMGGGLALIIKRSGGVEIEKEVLKKAPIRIGDAVYTTAGKLKSKYVIHAPTMIKPGEITNKSNVERATLAALKTADELKLERLAIPGMGAGVGNLPYDIAAETIIKAINKFKPKNLKEIYLIDINKEMIRSFEKFNKTSQQTI